MSDSPKNSALPDTARCLGCDYLLRGLTENRCPECGREFDPGNLRTFGVGPRLGWVARQFAAPLGWPTLLLGVAAVGLLVWVSGAPNPFAAGMHASAIDLRWYFRYFRERRSLRMSGLENMEIVYVTALYTALAAGLFWLVRLGGRIFTCAKHRRDNLRLLADWRRQTLVVVALLAMTYLVLYGWPRRTAGLWVVKSGAVWINASPIYPGAMWFYSPSIILAPITGFSPADEQVIVLAAVRDLPQPRQRMEALRILMHSTPNYVLDLLKRAVLSEKDAEVRAAELHLIGYALSREGEDSKIVQEFDALLVPFLNSSDPGTRAAAADALGLALGPAYPNVNMAVGAWLETNPPISLAPYYGLNPKGGRPRYIGDPYWRLGTPLSDSAHDALAAVEKTMLQGVTSAEREAAARAMLPWPPNDFKLRVAEWGVWIGEEGKMTLLQSVLDEIPPFVHRTSDGIASFSGRITHFWAVSKPIIHITASAPMVVDLEVRINLGRPWFAYPMPDDYSATLTGPSLPTGARNLRLTAAEAATRPVLEAGPTRGSPYWFEPFLAQFEPSPLLAFGKSANFRTGYPWLGPAHEAWDTNDLSALGLHWQSIIVSPTQLSWMAPPAVPDDPKFAWWKRLREVPSSYVSSRGESDRFLYYDGPTRMPPPLVVARRAGELAFSVPVMDADTAAMRKSIALNSKTEPASAPGPRRGLYIRISAGKIEGQIVAAEAGANVPIKPDLAGGSVESTFKQMLITAGLTEPEAAGMVDCWKPQFFQAAGERFLLVMSQADYDEICPIITIRPTPQEMVRVGVVLSEFR